MYSTLLRYLGGTTMTVKAIFGSAGKLIPDVLDLSKTKLSLTGPDTVLISNVGIREAAYSGELKYVGGGQLNIVGIKSVISPPAVVEEADASTAASAAAAAITQAEASAAAAMGEVEVLRREKESLREVVARQLERIATLEAALASALGETAASSTKGNEVVARAKVETPASGPRSLQTR